MTLRQTIQSAPGKTAELIKKLSATSNQAVKTREGLFGQLNDELTRYVEVEEQYFLPLLKKHSETKGLAGDAVKGNKDLRASLEKLAKMPQDTDEFLVAIGELDKSFQQYVRNERKELLPAVLKALSDEEAGELADDIETAVEDAEKAKREEAAQAKREAEEAEQAKVAERAAARAQKAAERSTKEATEKTVDTVARSAASAQDNARQMSVDVQERTQQAVSETREAMAAYGDSSQKLRDDLKAVQASSTISVGAGSEVYSAWMEWFGNATRANAEASRQLMQCRSLKQVVDIQNEFATSAMRNWMESNARMLQITQRASKQALSPLDGRLSEAA